MSFDLERAGHALVDDLAGDRTPIEQLEARVARRRRKKIATAIAVPVGGLVLAIAVASGAEGARQRVVVESPTTAPPATSQPRAPRTTTTRATTSTTSTTTTAPTTTTTTVRRNVVAPTTVHAASAAVRPLTQVDKATAVAQLEALGLVPRVREENTNITGYRDGAVVGTDPKEGTVVAAGSTVRMDVAFHPAAMSLQQAKAKWAAAGLSSYDFTFDFESDGVSYQSQVAVRDGRVAHAELVSGTYDGVAPPTGTTVEELFGIVADMEAHPDTAHDVILYHPTLGFPVEMSRGCSATDNPFSCGTSRRIDLFEYS